MHAYFSPIFSELELQRDQILDRVKNLSAEKFDYSSSPSRWSISQILTHILTAEQLSLGYMKKKGLGIDHLDNSGISSAFLLGVLKVSQRIPALKFRAPNVVVKNTPPALSLEELSKRWKNHHADLKIFLESVNDSNIKRLLYKHPFGGRFDARQAMIFSREHINHHLPQIIRLLY